MVWGLSSVAATNLLTKFLLLHSDTQIINSCGELAGTSKHLGTHASFDAYGLLSFVRNLGQNIPDSFWFSYAGCHFIVGLQLSFVDGGVLLGSLVLSILSFLLLSGVALLLLHLNLELVSCQPLGRCLLSRWWIKCIIVLLAVSRLRLNSLLSVETRSHFRSNMKSSVLVLHRHHRWAVVIRMIQLWLVTHHLLIILFAEGTHY